LHRDRTPFAGSFAFRRTGRAGVVPIHPPAFRGAGPQHHAPATGRAHRQACKQNWTRRHPRRLPFWAASTQLPLDLLEHIRRREVEAAGFKLVAEGDFWRHPEDARDFSIQPPSGKAVDEFVLKFQKPM